jgi:hypothetical protein
MLSDKEQKELQRSYHREYYPKNKARLNARHKKWQADNADKKKAYDQEYYAQNKDRLNTTARTWQRANPDKCVEYSQRFMDTHPDAYIAKVMYQHLKRLVKKDGLWENE